MVANDLSEDQRLVLVDLDADLSDIEENDRPTIGSVFSTRRPRDLGAGLSSGLKSALKGVGLGVASLIVAPTFGALKDGVGGFLAGLVAGVMGGVVLPVTGVGVGVMQIVRGVANTPSAVIEKSSGKKWSKEERTWKVRWYALDEEVVEIQKNQPAIDQLQRRLAAAAEKQAAETRAEINSAELGVADTTYYDVLQVEPNATSAEIRKSFFRLARECHPDKNIDDPAAHEKFLAVGEAYQVLGDEKNRAEYNLRGKQAAKQMDLMDSDLFFTILFGSECLDPYVGKIRMSAMVDLFDGAAYEGAPKMTQKVREFHQKKREVELAVGLRTRLEPYVIGTELDREKWRAAMKKEARILCQSMFGDSMTETIGWTYENYANQYAGKNESFLGLKGKYAKMQAKKRDFVNLTKIADSGIRASMNAKRHHQAELKREKEKEARDARIAARNGDDSSEPPLPPQDPNGNGMEDAIPVFDTLLQLCIMDIEATVRSVCKKVLKDSTLDNETRKLRVVALCELGKTFKFEAAEYRLQAKKSDPVKNLEEKFLKATNEVQAKRAHEQNPDGYIDH